MGESVRIHELWAIINASAALVGDSLVIQELALWVGISVILVALAAALSSRLRDGKKSRWALISALAVGFGVVVLPILTWGQLLLAVPFTIFVAAMGILEWARLQLLMNWIFGSSEDGQSPRQSL